MSSKYSVNSTLENKVNEQFQEFNQNWRKVENDSRKVGLRDGILDGREANFQVSFDKGYEEGFKNGFLLGKHKGLLIGSSTDDKADYQNIHVLERTRRGDCVICKDSTLLENDIHFIIKKQNECFKNNSEYLNKSNRQF